MNMSTDGPGYNSFLEALVGEGDRAEYAKDDAIEYVLLATASELEIDQTLSYLESGAPILKDASLLAAFLRADLRSSSWERYLRLCSSAETSPDLKVLAALSPETVSGLSPDAKNSLLLSVTSGLFRILHPFLSRRLAKILRSGEVSR